MSRTVGVEEEFLLFTAGSVQLSPSGDDVVSDAAARSTGQFQHELKQEQAELASEPHDDLAALNTELCTRRQELARSAHRRGARLLALATSPVDVSHSPTPDRRYEHMMQVYGGVARASLTCGMHVHVSVASPDEGVAVIDRLRPWLHVLVALTGNSPYFAGEDTGYASYRTVLSGQWPTSGPSDSFGDLDGYRRAAADLVASGAALDEAMLYFDARLSYRYPTVEVRVSDVCLHVEDATVIAALARGLVSSAARSWTRGQPSPAYRTGLLQAAKWGAARAGLDGELFDLRQRRRVPAWDLVDALVGFVEDALVESGDLDLVREGLRTLRERGTGATLQRRVFEEHGDFGAVITAAARTTA